MGRKRKAIPKQAIPPAQHAKKPRNRSHRCASARLKEEKIRGSS
jgi:hypothetical protein